MNLILGLLGSIFAFIGGINLVIWYIVFNNSGDSDFLGGVLIGALFFFVGIICLGIILFNKINDKIIIKKGKRYLGKIYTYKDDNSILINGSPALAVAVHYFDEKGVEREVIINTKEASNDKYPIGFTVEISEYKGKYRILKESIRNERLKNEEILMDDKPIDPLKLHQISVKCPSCGATFLAAEGYTEKCPYCKNYINT